MKYDLSRNFRIELTLLDLYSEIVIMLHDIVVTQCVNRALHARAVLTLLIGGSAKRRLHGVSCHFHTKCLFRRDSRKSALGPTQSPIQWVLGSRQSCPVNCSWSSPAQSFVIWGPGGSHDHIFVLFRLLRGSKWSPLLDKKRGLTATGHSLLLCWEVSVLAVTLTHSHSLWTQNSHTNFPRDSTTITFPLLLCSYGNA
jgi:hypothetical protein